MSESIRAVERALDVLMCFTSQTPELTMTQISEMVGINKSTVHRLLATLEGKRFVERDPVTGIYRPGIRLLQMAFLTLEHNDLRRLATPFLHTLCDQYRENVNLTVLDDTEVIYLDVIESSQRVKLAAAPGQRLPAFCTASGKAILAFLPEENARHILECGMPRYTKNTITSLDAFFEDMSQTRQRGYAISEQEFEEGINAIAAPICNHPIASVSIAGPAYRLTRERMIEMGPNLVAVANNIAKEVELAINLE
ncbi:MAG: IclR family transcriptional regulator [Anaerolineales bacterium]|nr:IclR family transcriptional regulator [Anaerolineales bacterium]